MSFNEEREKHKNDTKHKNLKSKLNQTYVNCHKTYYKNHFKFLLNAVLENSSRLIMEDREANIIIKTYENKKIVS